VASASSTASPTFKTPPDAPPSTTFDDSSVWQDRELTWAKAIHRVAADGISPEQAVDEALVRIKQILSE
jgi:hypothetical protein